MFCFVNHRYTETRRFQILAVKLAHFFIKYDVTLSTILWYNTIMDKLAYHLNKKKEPAKTEGKFYITTLVTQAIIRMFKSTVMIISLSK